MFQTTNQICYIDLHRYLICAAASNSGGVHQVSKSEDKLPDLDKA